MHACESRRWLKHNALCVVFLIRNTYAVNKPQMSQGAFYNTTTPFNLPYQLIIDREEIHNSFSLIRSIDKHISGNPSFLSILIPGDQ